MHLTLEQLKNISSSIFIPVSSNPSLFSVSPNQNSSEGFKQCNVEVGILLLFAMHIGLSTSALHTHKAQQYGGQHDKCYFFPSAAVSTAAHGLDPTAHYSPFLSPHFLYLSHRRRTAHVRREATRVPIIYKSCGEKYTLGQTFTVFSLLMLIIFLVRTQ